MPNAFTLTVCTSQGDAIPVHAVRKRVKNINLRVRPDGTVHLSAPLRASDARIEDFLARHASWIASHVKRARAKAAASPSGKAGVPGAARPQNIALWGTALPCPEVLGTSVHDLTDEELARRILAFHKQAVEDALPPIVRELEAAMGVHAERWTVRSMTTRWGSCTPKRRTIRIAAQLAAWPPECLQMVVAHELVHLMEPSHNARFHMLLDIYCPNNREATRRLKEPAADGLKST